MAKPHAMCLGKIKYISDETFFFSLISFYKSNLVNIHHTRMFQSLGFSLIRLIKEKTCYKTKSFPVLRMNQACTLA